jgi:putative transposase
MPNHVHLIPVPSDPDGLRRALARVHRSYAGAIQARRKRTGHFWQGRFGAVAMDDRHLAAALRYVSLNASVRPACKLAKRILNAKLL